MFTRTGEQRVAIGLEALCMSRSPSSRLLLAALVPALLAGATPVLGGTAASAASVLTSASTLTQVVNPGAEIDALGWIGRLDDAPVRDEARDQNCGGGVLPVVAVE